MIWTEQLRSLDASQAFLCAAAAYLLGCVSTGYILVRFKAGRDVREFESGSTGARNVGRLLGSTGFILTLLGDFAKGAVAVAATNHLTGSKLLCAIALLAVVAGHIWPATLGFRGGKGVATSLGALLFYEWQSVAVFAACFAITFALIRKSTLPAMISYVCLPLISFWQHRNSLEALMLATLAAFVIVAHRQNIQSEFSLLYSRRTLADKPQNTKP